MPHTRRELQAMLEAVGTHPKHHWGQCFLVDLNLMRLLVDHADPQRGDIVLEVGPGTGSLTLLLVPRCGRVVAVEIDSALAAIVRDQLGGFETLRVVETDVLAGKHAISPEVLEAFYGSSSSGESPRPRRLLIANLPYQVSCPLILNLLLVEVGSFGPVPLDGFTVTVQNEVAQRMIAQPCSREYGWLSILLQATGGLEMIRRLPPQAFWPAPAVHSAMIGWKRDAEKVARIRDLSVLRTVAEQLLRFRRKTVRACLADFPKRDRLLAAMSELGISHSQRGESLSPEQYVALANGLCD